jgi:hypothetical protein
MRRFSCETIKSNLLPRFSFLSQFSPPLYRGENENEKTQRQTRKPEGKPRRRGTKSADFKAYIRAAIDLYRPTKVEANGETMTKDNMSHDINGFQGSPGGSSSGGCIDVILGPGLR